MKFTSILTSLFGACAVLLPVLAAPVDLERRNTGVPSHIHYHSTFYRAVTGGELAYIHNYQAGHHPATYMPVPGDFAHGGALYVFAVSHQIFCLQIDRESKLITINFYGGCLL